MKKIFMMLLPFLIISCLFSQEDLKQDNIENKKYEISIGLGVPYGFFGVNVDYALNENTSLIAGYGVGYIVGTRWRPLKDKSLSLLALWGIAHLDRYKTIGNGYGISLGMGYESKSDWQIDLMYVQPISRGSSFNVSGYLLDNYGNVSLALGYRF